MTHPTDTQQAITPFRVYSEQFHETFVIETELDLKPNDLCVIDLDTGSYIMRVQMILPMTGKPTARFIRLATPEDLTQQETDQLVAKSILRRMTKELGARYGEAFHIVEGHFSLGRTFFTVYATAPTPITATSYLNALGEEFHTKIQLNKIDPREEVARLGGIGVCGRTCCCMHMSLPIQTVSGAIAHQQCSFTQQSYNGLCNRVKCCFRYEFDTFLKASKTMPPVGATCSFGTMNNLKIVSRDVFRRTVALRSATGTIPGVPVDQIILDK